MKHLQIVGLLVVLVLNGCGSTEKVTPPAATATVVAVEPPIAPPLIGGQLVTNAETVTADTVECPALSLPAGWTPRTEGALDERGVANLEAFARLYGYIRYWYPSDEAVEADWALLAWNGVAVVEDAPDVTTLAQRLNALFCPLAPTAVVYVADDPIPPLAMPSIPDSQNVTMWEHNGIGNQFVVFNDAEFEDMVATFSERRQYEIRNEVIPNDVHLPTDVWRAYLGGGIVVQFLLALYLDADNHTLPTSAEAPLAHLPITAHTPSSDDRVTRLGEVVIVWGLVQHFYAYKDVAPPDWDRALLEGLASAALAQNGMDYWETLQRLSYYVYDGHANRPAPPSDIQAQWAALPIVLASVEGQAVVTSVLADDIGLTVGDVIVTWDGVPMEERVAAMNPRVSANTATFQKVAALEQLSLGLSGETIEIVAQQPTGTVVTTTLTYSITVGTWYRAKLVVHEELPPIYETAPGIFYISVARLTEELIDDARPQLESGRGLILDYREYPGIAVNFAILQATIIENLGPEFYQKIRLENPRFVLPDQVEADLGRNRGGGTMGALHPLALPIVVLMDGSSISGSETSAAQFGASGAMLVGSQTAGSNGDSIGIRLPSGSVFAFTGQRAWQPDGTLFYGVGVLPTHPLEPTVAGIAAGRDELLEYAVTLLEAEHTE